MFTTDTSLAHMHIFFYLLRVLIPIPSTLFCILFQSFAVVWVYLCVCVRVFNVGLSVWLFVVWTACIHCVFCKSDQVIKEAIISDTKIENYSFPPTTTPHTKNNIEPSKATHFAPHTCESWWRRTATVLVCNMHGSSQVDNCQALGKLSLAVWGLHEKHVLHGKFACVWSTLGFVYQRHKTHLKTCYANRRWNEL